MLKRTVILFLISVVSWAHATGQVVTAEPAFPQVNDAVTIYFDATQGTGGLANCNCDVYLHTGVITSASTSPSDWKHVVTTWGQANANWRMDPVPGENNLYSYQINPSIADYYGVNMGEIVEQMAFVFRNADGSLEGKGDGGTDIYYTVYPDDIPFTAELLSPASTSLLVQLDEIIPIQVVSSESVDFSLYLDGNLVSTGSGTEFNEQVQASEVGGHEIEIIADNGTDQVSLLISYVVPVDLAQEDPPAAYKDGITFLDDNTVRLVLYAPFKDNVFVIGDFNDWTIDSDFQMKNSLDGTTWWIEFGGLTPGEQYTFQYLVDGDLRIADPYSTIVLDPFNDQFIPEVTYPNLPDYPQDQTSGIVTLLEPGATAYDWQNNDFERPENQELVIYELLLRDFIDRHDYTTLIDTLDYLDRLGVNAIQLMPVNEFEGNLSWGYNPSFHMALDKYYGPISEFKRFVDECHGRGIAVILDVVYNHAFSQSPLCQLYWDQSQFRPTPESPWFNVEATHAFNVGYDFNHESSATRNFVDQVMAYWLEEFRVDGFRFDLTKGFTQNTNGSFDAWAYDASRISILKHYADVAWASTPGAYIILEHFTQNEEEIELSNYGMMLWGNMNYEYNEASMGWNSNLNWGSYQERGWSNPHLIAYMESHDEERLMWKNLQFGNSNGDYDVRDLQTAIRRMELASAFFYTIPGPKMLWQFGEVAYDFSIFTCQDGTVNTDDDGCKLSNKPIRWDYAEDPDRNRLYDVTRALTYLKQEYEVFNTTDFSMNVAQRKKSINLNHPEMDVVVMGNFDVVEGGVSAIFPNTGIWYEYFTGDSIDVGSSVVTLDFEPGEYRLYSNVALSEPPGGFITSTAAIVDNYFGLQVIPNPSSSQRLVQYDLQEAGDVLLELYSISGQQISTLQAGRQAAGSYTLEWNQELIPGMYLLKLRSNSKIEIEKLFIVE